MRAFQPSIRQRLLALSIIPLVALLVIAGVTVTAQAKQRAEASALVGLVALSTRVTDLVHALQAERGMTGTYVNSRGAKMGDTLPGARQATDQAHAALRDYTAEDARLPEELRTHVTDALTRLDSVLATRSEADAFARPGPEFIKAYTGVVGSLLGTLPQVISATTDADLAGELSVVSSLAQAKEATGVLRAHLAAAFAADAYAEGQHATVIGLSARRQAFLDSATAGEPAIAERVAAVEDSDAATQMREISANAIARTRDFGQDSEAWFALASEVINDMRDLEKAQLAEVSDAAGALAARATWSLLALSLLLVGAVALTLFLAWRTLRTIMRTLGNMEGVLRSLREGRLDQRVELVGDDEITRMGASLNEALDALEGALLRIRGAADRLRDSAVEVEQVATSLHEAATDSSGQAADAATAARSLEEGVGSLSTAGDELTSAIGSIGASTRAAQSIVENAVVTSTDAARAVAELENSSNRIEDVLKAVAAISEQTNLLALNATIEAARAGEAGKGFAVVASEVKDLARETTEATEDIGRRIEQMRADTRAAGARIENVGATVSQMSSVQSSIAAAVEEQSDVTARITEHVATATSGTRAIADRIAGVAQAAERTDRSATTAQNSAGTLATVSDELFEIVHQFTIRN